MSPHAHPPHRRRRNSISRAEIVLAATSLVEAEGLDRLTMRRIGERLGSSPMAVYGHVADRDTLLVEMLETALSELPLGTAAAQPYARVEERMVGVHDFLAEHLWVPRLMTRGDLVATAGFGFADACMADLIAAGLTPADALFCFGECWHLLLGELLDRHPGDLGERPTQREQALSAIDVKAYPAYAHVLENLDPMDVAPPDRFEESIRLLLAGIRASR